MFDVFEEEKIITACMLGCLVLSIFLKILLGLLYQNMIRAADNMATTKNKQLKQCKLKFANCFELSGGVPNIPIFVDKFLNRLSVGHLSFQLLYHLSGQTMLLSVVFSGIGVCRSIMKGKTLGNILPFYIVSFFGLYLYFSVSTVADIKGKRRTLKINLVDYLENHLSPRIDVTRQDIERLYGEAAYYEDAGMTSRMDARGRRRIRAGAAGKKERRTVELMPISGRASVERTVRNPILAEEPLQSMERTEEAPRSTGRTDVGQAPDPAAVTEEELEALLKEFLAT